MIRLGFGGIGNNNGKGGNNSGPNSGNGFGGEGDNNGNGGFNIGNNSGNGSGGNGRPLSDDLKEAIISTKDKVLKVIQGLIKQDQLIM